MLALPACVHERDEVFLKAMPPVVGLERRHRRRKPSDAWQKERSRGRLNDEIKKSDDDLWHTEPSLRSSCEYALHCRDGRDEGWILPELVHAGIEAE